MLTALGRPLPPFLPPRTTWLTLHSERRKVALAHAGRKPAEPALQPVFDVVSNPAAEPLLQSPASATEPHADNVASDPNEQQQMEQIAGSLEDVARRLRGRGISALFRNEPDPLHQRLLRVIADHLADRGSG